MMRKILITGGTGFLGRHIVNAFSDNGDDITVVSRSIVNDERVKTVQADLSYQMPGLDKEGYDIVVHNAGLAHTVPKNEMQSRRFFEVNIAGTENLLKAIEATGRTPKQIIFISSVAVYGRDAGSDINEEHPLLGTSPYARSKIEAEQLIVNWCRLQNASYYILRLPLIVGKNAPGNLGAMVSAIRKGKYIYIGNNNAQKSMVLADDVAGFLIDVKGASGVYNLTDGHHPSFADLEQVISQAFKTRITLKLPKLPFELYSSIGSLLANKIKLTLPKYAMIQKILHTLTFSDLKAREELGWKSRPSTEFIKEKKLN